MNETITKVRKLILRAELSLINNQLSEAIDYNENARDLILENYNENDFQSLLEKVIRQKNEITLEMVKSLSKLKL